MQPQQNLTLDQATLSAALAQATENINMEAVNSTDPPQNLSFANTTQLFDNTSYNYDDEDSAWDANNPQNISNLGNFNCRWV